MRSLQWYKRGAAYYSLILICTYLRRLEIVIIIIILPSIVILSKYNKILQINRWFHIKIVSLHPKKTITL